jgi:hypothetical protein
MSDSSEENSEKRMRKLLELLPKSSEEENSSEKRKRRERGKGKAEGSRRENSSEERRKAIAIDDKGKGKAIGEPSRKKKSSSSGEDSEEENLKKAIELSKIINYKKDEAGPSKKIIDTKNNYININKSLYINQNPIEIKKDIILQVKNPKTGRMINVGGKVYNDLIKQGVIKPHEVNLEQAKKENAPKPKCTEVEKVVRPDTGRLITKNGKLYTDLVKRGIIKPENDLPKLPKVVPRNCKNGETFLLFEDVNSIEDDDFLKLPSGYCFSINEIIEWINSKAFDNKNPHNKVETMFTRQSLSSENLRKSPELVRLLTQYFDEHADQRTKELKVIAKHLDILYKIGNVGRICYYDNSTSHEAEDSSTFIYSITAISELGEAIDGLPDTIKNIFQNLKVTSQTVSNIIESANKGTLCIHGVGSALMIIFLTYFIELTKRDSGIKYDPSKSGIYFVNERGSINIYNIETRLIFNTSHHYYREWFQKTLEGVKQSKTMIWNKKQIKDDGLSVMYKAECNNEPDIVSINTIDEWKELEEWRKFRTEDGFCFDLLYLIRVVTDHLNTSSMTNPAPKYPLNIFTNKKLTTKDLLKLRIQISNNFLSVSPPLLKFLYNPDILWTEEEINDEWRNKLTTLFEKDMRYRREFSRIEDDSAILNCMWVQGDSRRPVYSPTEASVIHYLNNPFDVSVLRGMREYVTPMSYYFTNNFREGLNASLKHGYDDINDIPAKV